MNCRATRRIVGQVLVLSGNTLLAGNAQAWGFA